MLCFCKLHLFNIHSVSKKADVLGWVLFNLAVLSHAFTQSHIINPPADGEVMFTGCSETCVSFTSDKSASALSHIRRADLMRDHLVDAICDREAGNSPDKDENEPCCWGDKVV